MKGQFKIQQMAFMLIAVIVFFMFVLLFFLIFQGSGMRETAEKLRMDKAEGIAQAIADTPEFTCGTNCIDTDRVMVLLNRTSYYQSQFWSVTKIKIAEMYPRDGDVTCNLENYPNCDYYNVYDLNKPGSSVESYVSLCRREKKDTGIHNVCRLGKIIVGFENA
ncbi:MAG: hypothetical protein KKF56_04320 [Nanoarchaeota archaeon]|nr:hypothetical protein [Nanoarchaeota archaeon]